MNSQGKQLILACLIPILILLGMCATPLYTFLNGNEILLQTRPIDPSDLFRGDYVNLQYEAEEVPKNLLDKSAVKEIQKGYSSAKVYVLLGKKKGVYVPVRVTLERPKKGIYLKGNADYITRNDQGKDIVGISYSLDKYFVEDNSGTKLEEAARKGGLLAKVKVKNGYAILTDVIKKK